MIKTPYGSFPEYYCLDSLDNLCVKKVGIQTGPFGSQLHNSDYVSIGTPILTVEHLGENQILHENIPRVSDNDRKRLSRYIIKKGDIIFSRVGSVDRRALVREAEEGWLFSGRCLRIRPDPEKLDPVFLSYLIGLPSFKEYIRKIAVGATMPSINTEILSNIPISYPPLPIQHRIAHILGSLDDKIELNRQMNETLETMARAIFKSWFVDFDPIRAKAEGKQPAGMDAATAALFPSGFEEVDGQEVPRGWKILNLGDICTLDKGVSYKGEFLSDEGTSMINLGCFTGEGNFSIDNLKFYTGEYRDRHVVKPGDIVIANTDITQKRVVLGSPAIVPPFDKFAHCIFTHHVYAIRFKKEFENLNYFVHFSLLNPEFRERAIGFATGTTVLAIPRDTVLEHSVVMPDESIIQSFNGVIKPVFSMIFNNIQQSRKLAKIRNVLLPKLMSGEISVDKIEMNG